MLEAESNKLREKVPLTRNSKEMLMSLSDSVVAASIVAMRNTVVAEEEDIWNDHFRRKLRIP